MRVIVFSFYLSNLIIIIVFFCEEAIVCVCTLELYSSSSIYVGSAVYVFISQSVGCVYVLICVPAFLFNAELSTCLVFHLLSYLYF